jgi:hypothetical protein
MARHAGEHGGRDDESQRQRMGVHPVTLCTTECEMGKGSAGLGRRRRAVPRRVASRSRREQHRCCDLEMRGSRFHLAYAFRLTPRKFSERYPLVGALLAEIDKSERVKRTVRLHRA